MANPRYSKQRQDPKLEKLALLLQALPALQGPQMQRESQDQQALLALLGMGMQSDERSADREQRNMEALVQSNNMAAQLGVQNSQHQAALAAQQAQHQATLDQQATALAAQTNQNAAELGIKNSIAEREMAQRAEQEKLQSQRTMLAVLGQMPQQTPSSFLGQADALGVGGAGDAVKAMQGQVTNQNVQGLLSTLGPVYGMFEKNPAEAQQALDTLWQADPRLQDPLVQTAMQPHLDRLNMGVKPPEGAAPAGPQAAQSFPAQAGQYLREGYDEAFGGVADVTSAIRNYTSVPIWNFLAGLTGLPQQQPLPYRQ